MAYTPGATGAGSKAVRSGRAPTTPDSQTTRNHGTRGLVMTVAPFLPPLRLPGVCDVRDLGRTLPRFAGAGNILPLYGPHAVLSRARSPRYNRSRAWHSPRVIRQR